MNTDLSLFHFGFTQLGFDYGRYDNMHKTNDTGHTAAIFLWQDIEKAGLAPILSYRLFYFTRENAQFAPIQTAFAGVQYAF